VFYGTQVSRCSPEGEGLVQVGGKKGECLWFLEFVWKRGFDLAMYVILVGYGGGRKKKEKGRGDVNSRVLEKGRGSCAKKMWCWSDWRRRSGEEMISAMTPRLPGKGKGRRDFSGRRKKSPTTYYD